jgi:hypothetical protein
MLNAVPEDLLLSVAPESMAALWLASFSIPILEGRNGLEKATLAMPSLDDDGGEGKG